MSRCFLGSAIVSLVLASATNAVALSARVWVSGKGTDSAWCGPIATPCRTMQFAHDQTAPNGQIDVVDSAGYGSVTITKGISIVARGTLAGLLPPAGGGNAVTITAGATDAITLRGLLVDGAGISGSGIVFNSGGSLTVVDCIVQNFAGADNATGNGILLRHTSDDVAIRVSGSTIAQNGFVGLYYFPKGAGTQTLDVDTTLATRNAFGMNLSTNQSSAIPAITIANSTASNNSASGFHVFSSFGRINFTGNLASHNPLGFDIVGGDNTLIYLSRNTGLGNQFNGTGFDLRTTKLGNAPTGPNVVTFSNNDFIETSYGGPIFKHASE